MGHPRSPLIITPVSEAKAGSEPPFHLLLCGVFSPRILTIGGTRRSIYGFPVKVIGCARSILLLRSILKREWRLCLRSCHFEKLETSIGPSLWSGEDGCRKLGCGESFGQCSYCKIRSSYKVVGKPFRIKLGHCYS